LDRNGFKRLESRFDTKQNESIFVCWVARKNKDQGLRAARTKRGGCARCGLAIRGTPCVATPSEHLPRSARARRNPPRFLVPSLRSLHSDRKARETDSAAREKLQCLSDSSRVIVSFHFFLRFNSSLVRYVLQVDFYVSFPGHHHHCRRWRDVSRCESSDRQ